MLGIISIMWERISSWLKADMAFLEVFISANIALLISRMPLLKPFIAVLVNKIERLLCSSLRVFTP
jgi:hypothetical protein